MRTAATDGCRTTRGRVSVVLVALALGAAACGGSESSGGGDGTTLTIGGTLPLTGGQSEIGRAMREGAELAVEEANADQLLGPDCELALDIRDNQGKDELGVTGVQSFADDDLPAVLTSYTGLTLAAVPTAEAEQMVLLNGGGSGNELAGASDWLYNVFPVVRDEHKALAAYLTEQGHKKAAILHVENEFGNAYRDDFTEAFEGEIAEVQSFQAGAADVRSQLQIIKAANPDLLYLATGGGADTVTLVSQARELGIEAVIAGTANLVTPEVLELPAGEGIVHTTYALDAPEFVARYEERFDRAPTIYSTNYYDAVMTVATAFKESGATDCQIDGEALRKAISEQESFPGATGPFSFTNENVVSRPISVAVVKDGADEIVGESTAS
jgi:branched-chain amino acid transport system substrate-binding protein